MLAVIRTGGKQYLVKPGAKIKIEKIDGKAGEKTAFNEVLLVVDDKGEVQIGTPLVKGMKVEAKVLKQDRAKKVIVFKYKPKKRYQKKAGHRQPYTEVEILEIKKSAKRTVKGAKAKDKA